MAWLRFLVLAGLAAGACATTRPAVFADLADRARSLPPEFAADALLRIADSPNVTDVAWKRQVLEDAFHLAAGAQQAFARHDGTGRPTNRFDKSYAQGMDACTLQSKAVDAMLTIDYKRAREMFGEIPPPQVPRLSCKDTLVYDVSIFYVTAGEVATRAFSAKEVAEEQPFHLLQRYTVEATSPAQIAPIARMLVGATLKPAQFEALVNSLAGTLTQLSGDDRSFSAFQGEAEAAITGLATECARRRINAQPLVEAWGAYKTRQLSGERCTDSTKPVAQTAGRCASPQCQQLAAQFNGLIMGPNAYGFTPEQKSTPEWAEKFRQYLAAVADWKGDDDPDEYFQVKSQFYGDLFNLTPHGPERDVLLRTMLAWLQENGYRREHRVEWFYPVNTLIVHLFADPLDLKATARELRLCADPVIALYAQLEQLMPRPVAGMMGLGLL
jgi:hypothetical protein